MRHVIPQGWEESLGVDVGSSVIKGSRMKFLRSLIEDVQARFKRGEWDGSANLEDWVEASSSAVPSTSSNPGTQLVFRYDVDEAVLSAMERGRLHEWTKVEFQAICRKHGLSVRGGKGELMERVRVHFHRLYQQ